MAATERQQHMGLLRKDGTVDKSAIRTIAKALAGMMFDDLCEYADRDGGMLSTIARLTQLRERTSPRDLFLAICMVYDEMRRPLPDLIWWIAGNDEIVPIFVDSFVQSLSQILKHIQNEGGHSE